MSKDLSQIYQAQKVEDKIYNNWEKTGFFRGKILKGVKPFVISMPPPNATGVLHIGHAMFVSLQDLMIRFHRLQGEPTLWLPGVDHAAIATQAKMEKIIWQKEKKTRYDLGRVEFLQRVDEYVAQSSQTIRQQIRKLGASCDWSRERFTLDQGLSYAVKEVFVRMYQDGLIYRGWRLVNWCPRCASTLADDEVEYEEIKSKLYYIKYGPLVIATTRPETKLGDTGLAVHPEDSRYKKYIGQKLEFDLANHKIKVKVFADKGVDQKFGSGVIGVTPAHSQIDYDWAQKYNLEMKQVIGPDGRMTGEAGRYKGLTVVECREKFVQDLGKTGLIDKIEDYSTNLSICYRCDAPIEPLLSNQWFVDVNKKISQRGNKSLKELGERAVKFGKIKIIPKRFEKVYLHWFKNLRDWCISRQIWYGHRIPVWYCKRKIKNPCLAERQKNLKNKKINKDDSILNECEPIVSVKTPRSCPHCGSGELAQDPDTLDTWFSSGLWTFSTLGWPKETEDLKYFHPTTVLETAYDILPLWVARMIMLTKYALGEEPFKSVYFHGLVRDKLGRKMSKSLGNVIDPLEMIQKFGADAVRLSLVIGNSPGNDSRIFETKIAGFRNFVNKFWNISRFILNETMIKNKRVAKNKVKTLTDRWILSRLNQVIQSVTDSLKNFRFSQAGETLKTFTWEELADWYLEIAKIEGEKTKILREILLKILILWHPFMPFATEEIYQKSKAKNQKPKISAKSRSASGGKSQDYLIVQNWPKSEKKLINKKAEKEFKIIQEIIKMIRNARAEYQIPPANKISALISAGRNFQLIEENKKIIKDLARLDRLEINKKIAKPKGAISLITNNLEIYLLLASLINFEEEKQRINLERQKTSDYLKTLEKKLANREFISHAPQEIIQKEKEKLMTQKDKLIKLDNQLKNLN